MTEPVAENKLERVRALLALAERAGTEAEAELARGRAMEMMAKYGIDQAMLAAAGKTKDSIVMRAIKIVNPYSEAKASMLGWIAEAMRCRVALVKDPSGRSVGVVEIVGYESDIDRAEILFTSLLLQATGQVIHVKPSFWENVSTSRYRKSWFYAFGVAVTKRVKAMEDQAEVEYVPTDAVAGTALVLADRRSQVELTFKTYFPNTTAGKAIDLGAGARQGYSAGQRADIGNANGVGGTANRRQIS